MAQPEGPHPAHLLASEGSIFDSGFRKPANEPAVGSRPRDVAEVVPWRVVETFLVMAREAQRVRSEAFTELQHKLEAAHERLREEMQERSLVARQEVAAEAESSFLTTEVQALLLEKQQLKDRVRQLERENQFLVEENSLLHRQVEAEEGEDGLVASMVRLQEDLRCEQQRCDILESEAMDLRVRVAALERANQAQHVALLSCIEEAERARMQQDVFDCSRLENLSLAGSPRSALVDWLHRHRSECTDDTDYDSNSHSSASCTTPSEGNSRRRRGRSVTAEHPGSPSVLLVPKKVLGPLPQLQQQQQRRQQRLRQEGQGEAATPTLSS